MSKTEAIKAFFFASMLKGYVGAGERRSISDMPGYKKIQYASGDFMMVDLWCTRDMYSAGTTTIYYKNRPVWWMSYAGWYRRDVIPFLKKALLENYEKNVFYGGRGGQFFILPGTPFVYSNHLRYGVDSFTHFGGEEYIFDQENHIRAGEHEYFGMSLI